MPTVSIIVPVYNAQTYLHKCIDSLLSQDFKDFELILVNDGSKDNSKSICDEYARKDNRVKVIHKDNGGVSSARNTGLTAAQGEYIMFCDSDDYVSPLFCKALLDIAKGNHNCLTLSGITKIREDKQPFDELCPEYTKGETVSLSKQEFCDMYVRLNNNAPFRLMHMPINKLFSRKVIEENNLKFDTSIHFNEDFIFNLNYLNCVDKVNLYNDSIYFYYLDTPQSLTKKYIPNLFEMFKAKEDCYKRVISAVVTDKNAAHKHWCDMVIDDVQRALSNTVCETNPQTKKEKYRYCNKLIRTKDFKEALKGADKSKYSSLYIKIMKLGSYRLYELLLKLKG